MESYSEFTPQKRFYYVDIEDMDLLTVKEIKEITGLHLTGNREKVVRDAKKYYGMVNNKLFIQKWDDRGDRREVLSERSEDKVMWRTECYVVDGRKRIYFKKREWAEKMGYTNIHEL